MSEDDPCRNFVTVTSCPLCHEELIINWQGDDIPYFGEVMYITSKCACGFRFADTMILAQRDPVRYELKVRDIDDLNSRVVRSTSGTIRIPELGIDVEPGSISESYVTNIEGVLDRILNVVITATRWAENDADDQRSSRGLEVHQALRDAMEGNRELTVVIEDPLGNSAIISEKAVSRKLTPEEAAKLKTGMIVFDTSSPDMGVDACDTDNSVTD
ncbi:MAG: ZPR1 zinc finger domain-containing protein [Methanosarcinaceae archaeon]|nr:ZPR1 zinc finger domain-containing protein [Methanosarcinaceae archaeon]